MPAGMVSFVVAPFVGPDNGVEEEDDDEEDAEWDDLCEVVERERSLKCVSRCCFMLSARVNFFIQPAKEHPTAFSAVCIFEWRDAWPEVVKVLSHPCESL
jgi:hypothetical protein